MRDGYNSSPFEIASLMPTFSSSLISWQCEHGRNDLPWQGADPYRVWLSEVMLQQTQVATVIPYYLRFVASFPDVVTLANASEDEVLAHWSGLGYYARGRNLHRAARMIVDIHGGQFPQQYEQILALPGIGRSTAAAISAQAFHERRAILDGNVKRVLARYCGISGQTSKRAVEEELWQQAELLLPDLDIATYTQALMDMGAMLCTRSRPKCAVCPVQGDCIAMQTGRVNVLPTPKQKKLVPERSATFLLAMSDGKILLEKRKSSGIWGGLWCLPQFDEEDDVQNWCALHGIESDKLIRHHSEIGEPADSIAQCEALVPFAHVFTHFKLHITPLLLYLAHKPPHQTEHVWLELDQALQAAIPTPVRLLLSRLANF